MILSLLIGFIYSNINPTTWGCESVDNILNNHPLIYLNNRENDKAVIRAQIWEIHRSDSL